VERAFNPGPVVVSKLAQFSDHASDIGVCYLFIAKLELLAGETGLCGPAQVHDDFD
jgi:hypothetical protein